MIKGYVIFNENGRKLCRDLYWASKEYPGWVFSKEELKEILQKSSSWKIKPVAYQPAISHPETNSVELLDHAILLV